MAPVKHPAHSTATPAAVGSAALSHPSIPCDYSSHRPDCGDRFRYERHTTGFATGNNGISQTELNALRVPSTGSSLNICYGPCLICSECARDGHQQKQHHLTAPRTRAHPQPLHVREKYSVFQWKQRHQRKERNLQFYAIRLHQRPKKQTEPPVRQELPRRVNSAMKSPVNGQQGSRDVTPQPPIRQDSQVSPATPSLRQARRVSSFFTNSHASPRDVETSHTPTSAQRDHKRPRAHPASSVRSQAADAETQTQPSPGITDVSPPSPDQQHSSLVEVQDLEPL